MNENSAKISLPASCPDMRNLSRLVLTAANLGPITSLDASTLRYIDCVSIYNRDFNFYIKYVADLPPKLLLQSPLCWSL